MSFKQLWAFYSPEEAFESAKVLEQAGIACRLSRREKGVLGDPATSDLIWVTVAEADYRRASELLGVNSDGTQDGSSYHYQPPGSVADEKQDLMMKCPLCQSLNVVYDNQSFKSFLGRLFTMPWSRRRFFCEDCKHIWDRNSAAESES